MQLTYPLQQKMDSRPRYSQTSTFGGPQIRTRPLLSQPPPHLLRKLCVKLRPLSCPANPRGAVISKLGKKLQLRQRVIATAIVFFRRFYTKNSYCDTDPFIVVAACCYLASKAEESPLHIKNVVAEARLLFSRTSCPVSI
jgi:hypothetical protein